MFRPLYRYTHTLVTRLLEVETARAAIEALPLGRSAASDLRERARKARLDAAGELHGAGQTSYQAALTLATARGSTPPTEADLLELQRALTSGRQAGYRGDSSVVYGKESDLYVPPEAEDVQERVLDLLEWLAGAWTRPAVPLAGICEQELSLIQPFPGGNAAMARLLAEMILARRGYSFAGLATIERALLDTQEEYHHVRRGTHTGVYPSQADFTQWLELFAGALAAAAADARHQVQASFDAANRLSAEAAPDAPTVLKERQLMALRHMQANGAIKSGEYQKLARIVPDTARRDFDELIDKGLIAVKGVGRGTHYVLTQKGGEELGRRAGSGISA